MAEGSWLPVVSKTAGPLYLAIADALAADVRSGRLPPGTRLPPQRVLAEALEIDFTTVSRAYAEARRRGLVEGKVGQGTYVRARSARPPAAAPAGSGPIDMSMNMPPGFDDPDLTARMWDGMRDLQESGIGALLRYQEPGGARPDREAGCAWLAPRLGNLPPSRLLVCPGAQAGLTALLGSLAEPGDAICAEALVYPGFRAAAGHLRLTPVAVPVDAQGLIPEAFEAIVRERRPKALYCNPTLHNPTTATLPLERRLKLVEIARANRVPIIEDDAYGALPAKPVPPLAALAPDIVFHLAGLAKCLSPALRIAYLAVPDERAAARAAGALRAVAAMASPLTAGLATRWIEDGTAGEVLDAIRAETRARLGIARDALDGLDAIADPEGFHVWLKIRAPWTRGELVAQLRSVGIGVVASDAFALATAPEAVRLGLGVPTTREMLARGLQAMADLMAQPPALSSIVV